MKRRPRKCRLKEPARNSLQRSSRDSCLDSAVGGKTSPAAYLASAWRAGRQEAPKGKANSSLGGVKRTLTIQTSNWLEFQDI